MGQNKLERFEAIKKFENVFEKGATHLKGKWHEFFGNRNPIILELACGKGEYTQNRAEREKDKNFIGIDVKGNRMYIGAKYCLNNQITNAAFLRIPILEICDYFAPGEVSDIWIIFPDPFLRGSKEGKRLTHHRFLALYQKVLRPGGKINLKTDSKPLFDFTEEVIAHHQLEVHQRIDNIYAQGDPGFPLNILTFYEKMHLADQRTIQYISFSLPQKDIQVPPKKVLSHAE